MSESKKDLERKAWILINRVSFDPVYLSDTQIPFNSKYNTIDYDSRDTVDHYLGYNTNISKTYNTVPNSIRIVKYNLVGDSKPKYFPRGGGDLEYSRDTTFQHSEKLIAAANGGAIINFE